mgnify:CR=1 FL=1
MTPVDLWCRATYRRTPGQKAQDRAAAAAIPKPRAGADPQLQDMARRYADAKARFVYYTALNTVRLPQPESGKAFYERGRAISDFDFFWKELMAAGVLRMLDEEER